jgi:hypothetical protein
MHGVLQIYKKKTYLKEAQKAQIVVCSLVAKRTEVRGCVNKWVVGEIF